jgi:hypothetical protein
MINNNNNNNKPHYQALRFNIPIPENYSYIGNLYSQELQDNLLRYEVEKWKMPITVTSICYNKFDNYINDGGNIQLSVGIWNDSSEIDLKFSTLKSTSVYSKYLFNDLTGDDILGVYGELYYKLPNTICSVKTYTIVYELKNGIREVTLHNLGLYGKILTRCDLIK